MLSTIIFGQKFQGYQSAAIGLHQRKIQARIKKISEAQIRKEHKIIAEFVSDNELVKEKQNRKHNQAKLCSSVWLY